MKNNVIATLTKSLGARIVWIGGATAGITALFSALGFLVIKGHHDLLGISGLVPTDPNSWAIEGAKFAYSTVYVLLAGCLNRPVILALAIAIAALLGLASSVAVLKVLRKFTTPPLIQVFLAVFTLAMLIASLAWLVQGLTSSDLLIQPSDEVFQQEILPRLTEAGRQDLAFRYAAYAMLAAFLAIWLKELPLFIFSSPAEADGESAAPENPVWYSGLWLIFLIHLLLLPILYGQLVKDNDYFKVCLLPAIEAPGTSPSACMGHQGWLLYKGKEEIALYMAGAQAKPIQVFKQAEFTQIQVLTHANMMTAIPPPASPGPGTSPSGSRIAQMGQFLRNIPATLAAGIKPTARVIPVSQRTLVIANASGQTLNTFSPFQDDQKGSLESPVFLPDNENILYVEVVDNTPHLKIVSASFDPTTVADFGTPAIEGWDPLITPDGQFVIFRQGATQVVRTSIDGSNSTTLIEEIGLGKLLGVFPEDDDQGYTLVYSNQQDNTLTYWSATFRSETLIAPEQKLDEKTWRLLEYISVHNDRILYEQEDSIALVEKNERWVLAGDETYGSAETRSQSFLNIYLSDSIDSEGQRITNTSPGTIPTYNRYPEWSLDGTLIVYTLGE